MGKSNFNLMIGMMVGGVALIQTVILFFYFLAKYMNWIPATFTEKAQNFGGFVNNLMIAIVAVNYIQCL